MEQESDDRSICAIISDTRAGKVVRKEQNEESRKRTNKAKVKAETAEEKAVKKQEILGDQNDKTAEEDEAMKRPQFVMENGKRVLVMPKKVISTANAVSKIKQQSGSTVERGAGRKISPLDNVRRDPTDRWST